MKLPTATLIKFLVIFALRSTNEAQAEAAVGLYGPDRYEGLPETCLMPMEFGYCRAKVQRYYFDIRRMKCTMFFWGGCAGNDNNFKSIEECNNFCTSPYEDQVQYNQVEVKEKRTEGRGSTNIKYNAINSRDSTSSSSSSKSVPKFALKPNVTSKETGYKGSFKASSKSFSVVPPPKSNNNNNNNNNNNTPADIIEDEDYDD